METTFNAQQGFPVTSAEQWAREHLVEAGRAE